MAGRRHSAGCVPTPGPWLVRGTAGEDASPLELMLDLAPATDEAPGGWPYLIRCRHPVEPGGCCLHIACGIQRLADAQLMAAAPELAAGLLGLLTAPDLSHHNLNRRTRLAVSTGWDLLVAVAPHPRDPAVRPIGLSHSRPPRCGKA